MPNDDTRSEDAARSASTRADDIAEAELVTEALADRPAEPVLPVPAPVRRRGGGFFGAVTGGILAAAAGFGLARVIPGGWPVQDVSGLEAQLTAQTEEMARLQADLAALAARPLPDAAPDIAALRAELKQRLAESSTPVDPAPAIAAATRDLRASVAALETRLSGLERQSTAPGGAASATALAAFERELQDLRAQIAADTGPSGSVAAQIEAVAAEAKAQLAAAAQDAERMQAAAAAAAKAAATGAALGRIRAALEGGGPFEGAAADLAAAGFAIPPELASLAAAGAPSLADLQRSFPPLARDALTAALRAQAPAGWGDRITAFLRMQTGARSLAPRAGTDPDAILSRAEGQLSDGNVAAALAELAGLPDAARQLLAPWVAKAEARQKAFEALGALAATADAQ